MECHALYYPFHLCHERTLERLLKEYSVVHFRDFMALQLTPFMERQPFPIAWATTILNCWKQVESSKVTMSVAPCILM